MAKLFSYPHFRAFLADGSPAVGYRLYGFLAGTTTATPLYKDQAQSAQHTQPITLDGNGEVTEGVWLAPNVAYKLVLKTDADVEIWSRDNIQTQEGGYLTTLTLTGQLTSTVASGTAPFVIASTTEVANLRAANASQLLGKTWAVPDPIGATTPAAGSFTTLAATGATDLTGNSTERANSIRQTANGAQWIEGQSSEEVTLNTGAAATDSVANLLPANSLIEAVEYRITETITTAANFTVGDATQAARFLGTQSTLTAGTTGIGLLQHNPANASNDLGPVQSAAAKVRITCNAAPGAGKLRLTIFYRSFVAPTS